MKLGWRAFFLSSFILPPSSLFWGWFMPETSTSDSLKLANVQVDDLLTMGDDSPIDLAECSAAPATPGGGRVRLYAKGDGRLYLKDDGGTEVALDAATGGAVLASLFEANSILAANADDTPAPVTVAEDRLVGRKSGGSIAGLTAAEVLAIVQDGLMMPPISGRWYSSVGQGKSAEAHSPSLNTLYAFPTYLPRLVTWDGIGAAVDTPQAGKECKLGIYSVGSDGLPDSRIYGSSGLGLAAAGNIIVTGIAQTLEPGWYYLAFRSDATGTARMVGEYSDQGMRLLGATSPFAVPASWVWCNTGTYAADGLPETFPAVAGYVSTYNRIRIVLKAP